MTPDGSIKSPTSLADSSAALLIDHSDSFTL
jgi:hypothetical protein